MNSDKFWSLVCDVEYGDRLYVEYDSARSEEVKDMEGQIIFVDVEASGNLKVVFERDDGQVCKLYDDGLLYSEGSKYPRTGDANKVELV